VRQCRRPRCMRRTLTTHVTRPVAAGLLGLALAFAVGCGSSRPQASGASPSASRSDSHSPERAPSPTPSASCGTPAASEGAAATQAGDSGRSAQETLNAVQFVGSAEGWVVGSDRILHTTDGGQHWVTQYLTSRKAGLATVDFTDASHGWVVGATTILATSDGGAHWHALPEPCKPVRAVHFFSASDGIAVAGGGAPYLGVPSGGGVLLRTTDGGAHWRQLPSPKAVQSVCFTGSQHGWLGAGGNIYGTANGGQTWTLAVRGPHVAGGSPRYSAATTEVECAGPSAAWAELIGPGVGMSHQQQVGYHTSGGTWQPIFAEQYFPHPGVHINAEAPGVYSGPFSAISPAQAVFIGFCGPCSSPQMHQSQGTAPLVIATEGGAVLLRRGNVGGLEQANGAAFVSADVGWVVGTQTRHPRGGPSGGITVSRIVHTADGGRTWQVQYVLGQ
jgi:photosystem II stability/assembly factor-like uncharacterized protein